MLDKVTKCQDDDIDSNDTENVELESKVFVAWLYFINDGTTPTSKDSSDSPLISSTKPEGYIGPIWDIPEDIRDNLFILTGYRVGFNDIWKTSKTIFMWHNETMNVWTHLIGKICAWITIIFVLTNIPNYEINGLDMKDKLSELSIEA
jgi:hypothetical protein